MAAVLAKFDEEAEGAGLYLLGLSTVEALRLFAPDSALAITGFFAEFGYGRSRRYCALDELPVLATAGEAIQFLERTPDLDLIDFDARLGDGATLSTHDDGEAHFRVASRARAVELLDAALWAQTPASRAAVLAHPGCYVLIADDGVRVFANFDAAVASGRLD